ncbi:MAG: dihydropyrimidine dehydrogenase, partial [Syntrophomonadaceae bacterium]|nr:dihydropyrimidine dehydrogenase [Syntrophomonadaceae bacterium]
TNKSGMVTIDEATGKTSKTGVYAGGDLVTGAATVVQAINGGRKAAHAINEYLMGCEKSNL